MLKIEAIKHINDWFAMYVPGMVPEVLSKLIRPEDDSNNIQAYMQWEPGKEAYRSYFQSLYYCVSSW